MRNQKKSRKRIHGFTRKVRRYLEVQILSDTADKPVRRSYNYKNKNLNSNSLLMDIFIRHLFVHFKKIKAKGESKNK